MLAGGSTYFILACVVVGAMAVIGLGVLFVRAVNIERTTLVAGTTLVACLIAAIMLWNASAAGQRASDGVAWSAIALSIFGFSLGRIWDVVLGPRSKVHHDDATLGTDLAD